jgi:hypothetical protein
MPKIYVPVKRRRFQGDPQAQTSYWADEVKIKAVTSYLALGSLKEAADFVGIPYETIQAWKRKTTWWAEVEEELRESDNIKSSNKVKSIVNMALDGLQDRVKNGDMYFDPKTKKVRRTPLKARELNTISNTMIDRHAILTRQPTRITQTQDKVSLENKLDKLAHAFIKFAEGRAKERTIKAEYDVETADIIPPNQIQNAV